MKRLRSFFFALLFIIFTSIAYPCGGPQTYPIDSPLLPIEDIGDSMTLTADDYGFYTRPRDEFLFLYPFWIIHKDILDDLWNISYKASYQSSEDGKKVFLINEELLKQTPDLSSFESFLSSTNWAGAKIAAEKIIKHIIDMPSNQAQLHNQALKRALEFWELEPHLKEIPESVAKSFFLDNTFFTTKLAKPFQEALTIRNLKREEIRAFLTANPRTARSASLQFVILQETMKNKIPNGWPSENMLSKDTWNQLETMIDDWLRQFPNHPLADLVQLMKVRLYYFKLDYKAAFSVLLKMYPKHLPRVLAEMRHIGEGGSEQIVNDETVDPILRTALLPVVGVTPEQWDKLWLLSEVNRNQAWAINLQERLLYLAVREGDFPHRSVVFSSLKKFPDRPDNPTQLWGELRLLVLLENEQWDKAWSEAASLPEDETVAILKARYYIIHGNAWEAVKLKKLPWYSKRYLIDVLLSIGDLKKILPEEEKKAEYEVILTIAIHQAYAGDWDTAANMIKKVDLEKAKLWKQCAELYRNNSQDGLLQWARFLNENDGMIFYGNDIAWYRSLNYRNDSINRSASYIRKEWTVEYEKSAIECHLLNSTELWLALQTYIKYLSKASPSPQACEVLKEADLCYNKLINYDSNNSQFWSNYFKDNQFIAQLRSDGVRLRKK